MTVHVLITNKIKNKNKISSTRKLVPCQNIIHSN
jgi:hypothetical protein